jgi:flagellar FliJ protein
MPRNRQTLTRIHRVRTIQLNLTRADEVEAQNRAASEAALSARIASLAAAVAPTPSAAGGFSLTAAAHYRDRLHQSASAAQTRVEAAEYRARAAGDATRAARRDQNAVEKLIERARADDVLKAVRALEEAPAFKSKRHDPC